MIQKPTNKTGAEDIEESGKTLAFDPTAVDEPERTETLTRSSLYPTRSRGTLFFRNPIFIFSVVLALLIGLVFGLLYGIGEREPKDTDPQTQETAPPDKDPAPWRVGGLMDAATIPAGNIHSDYAILVNMDSMEAVAGKSMHERMYPASMTKIMTFIVAYETIEDHTRLLEVTQAIKNQYAGASRHGFDAGDLLTVEQCLYAMILGSDTDAVLLLCEAAAGGEDAFVALMNAKAEEMGLSATHFENATGLHHKEHYTTACEMAEILAYAMQIPRFETMATTETYVTYLKYYNEKGELAEYRNTFQNSTLYGRFKKNGVSLTLSNGGKILGGKTGFTDEAENCQAAIARDADGVIYLGIFAKAPSGEKSAKDTRYVFDTYLK